MKQISYLLVILTTFLTLQSCGGSSPTTPSSIPISLEDLDGTSGVSVDSSFLYTFDAAVDTSTVSTGTYFIVPTLSASTAASTSKTEFNSAVCDSANALAATVSCDSNTECLLDPTENLEYGTSYTACLTAGILTASMESWLIRNAYAGDPITPVAITFVTETLDGELAVASVLDGDGAPVSESGSTGVYADQFTVTFTDNVTVPAGGITFECTLPSGSSLAQPSLDISVSNAQATVDVADAYKYQLMECTLVVTSNVTKLGGDPLSEAKTYQFTNGCALEDDFNADSQECWTPGDSAELGFTWTTWGDILANALTFDPVNSTLDLSLSTTSDQSFGIIKAVNVDSGNYSLTMYITSLTTFTNNAFFALILTDENIDGYEFGISNSGGVRTCIATTLDNNTVPPGESVNTNCTTSARYMRLSNTDSVITFEVSTDGSSWDEIAGGALPYIDMSGEMLLSIYARTESPATNTANFEYITLENITSNEQY